jgi:hypothetical protein
MNTDASWGKLLTKKDWKINGSLMILTNKHIVYLAHLLESLSTSIVRIWDFGLLMSLAIGAHQLNLVRVPQISLWS